MDKYQLLDKRGQGSYAVVWKARSRNNELVAIKQFRQAPASWSEVKKLVEVEIPRALGTHRNITVLKEVILEHGEFFLVYEYCESSVYETINHLHSLREGVNKTTIRWLVREILQGLAHIHRSGFMHRDIKPENMLLSSQFVKICDFGTAKVVNSMGDFTSYVGTRWYRAPECLLEATMYTEAVDMWAVGVIMAEFYLRRPIFPGTSDIDQLFRICSVIGSPTVETWREGHELARRKNYKFPRTTAIGIASLIPTASHHAIRLMESLLNFDPAKRPSARTALESHFFKEGPSTPLKPYVDKAKGGRTRAEAAKLQQEISLAREGRLDMRRGKVLPASEYADPLHEDSGKNELSLSSLRNFNYGNGYGGRGMQKSHSTGRNKAPTEYADPLHEDSSDSDDMTFSKLRNFSHGNGYGGRDTHSKARGNHRSNYERNRGHSKKSFSNAHFHSKNSIGKSKTFNGSGSNSNTRQYVQYGSQDSTRSEISLSSKPPDESKLDARLHSRTTGSHTHKERPARPKHTKARRSRRQVTMLSSDDKCEIDAHKHSANTAATSTPSAGQDDDSSDESFGETTPPKGSNKRTGKEAKNESKNAVDRGKSTSRQTHSVFSGNDGEFVINSHALVKTPHIDNDDFWNSGTTNWSGNAPKEEDKGTFMDEILSSWLDDEDDNKASGSKYPVTDAGASLGGAAAVNKENSFHSLAGHRPSYADSDQFSPTTNRHGDFWSKPAPVIIGKGASSSLKPSGSHKRSMPLPPVSGFAAKTLSMPKDRGSGLTDYPYVLHGDDETDF